MSMYEVLNVVNVLISREQCGAAHIFIQVSACVGVGVGGEGRNSYGFGFWFIFIRLSKSYSVKTCTQI